MNARTYRSETALVANCIALGGGMLWAWHRSSLPSPVISFLLQNKHAPGVYVVASFALAAAATLLAIAGEGLSSRAAKLLLRAGCAGLLLMAGLAPFSDSTGPVHDVLSALSLMLLLLAVMAELHHTRRDRPSPMLLAGLAVVIASLVAAYLLPDWLDDSHWYRSLALCEWAVIAVIDAGVFILICRNRLTQMRTSSR